MKIVFMGSAQFGIPALEKLLEGKHSIVGVVSTPATPKGRGLKPADSPVSRFALEKGIAPVFNPESLKSEGFAEALRILDAEVFIVVAYRILPREIFSIPPLGAINIHASLLPKYRGPAPIQRAIAAGEKETGITIFRIDAGVDSGRIILQKTAPVGIEETTPQLYNRLSLLGAEGLREALELVESGKAVFTAQDISAATPAPKLSKAEGRINWNMPARAVFNMIRAFKPFPGTFAFLNGSRLGIEWALPLSGSAGVEPGTICAVHAHGIDVQCLDSRLAITEVRPEGKKAMDAGAFTLGRTITAGMRFE